MAKIPLYSSRERLTTETPFVRESPQVAGQPGRDLQGVGESVSQAHGFIRQAYDFQQMETGKVKTVEIMDKVSGRAASDGRNTGDLSSYDDEIRRGKAEALSGISNPSVRARMEAAYDLQASQTRTQIIGLFRKNMQAEGLAALQVLQEKTTREYAETGDEGYIKDLSNRIDLYVEKGFLRADAAQKIKTDTVNDARNQLFINDLQTSPKVAKERLASNFYNFDVETMSRAENLYGTEIKKIQNDHEEELDQMDFDNNINEETIDVYVKKGWIEPKSGITRKKALIAEEAKNPDSFAYNSMIERAASVKRIGKWGWPGRTQKEKEERFREAATLRNDVLRMRIEGKLTKDESREIFKKMGNALEDFAPYKDGILQLKGFADRNYTPEEKDAIKKELYQNFMDKVKNNVDPVLAITQTKDEFIKDKRPEIAQYVVGETYSTPYGQIKVVGFDEDGEPIIEPLEVE